MIDFGIIFDIFISKIIEKYSLILKMSQIIDFLPGLLINISRVWMCRRLLKT